MTNVLVIDDSQEMLDTISMILEDAGYHGVLTLEPQRALGLCEQIEFDAVICDVFLKTVFSAECPTSPLTGLELMFELLGRYPKLPIIAMSGNLESKQLKRLEQSGIRGLIAKPFNAEELIEGSKSAVDRKGQEGGKGRHADQA